MSSIVADDDDRLPLGGKVDYSWEYIAKRREWITKNFGLDSWGSIEFDNEDLNSFKGNIENLVGVAKVPLGVIGPLKINGDYATGSFCIPLATTEGVLVSSFHRGARLITKAGGANIKILKKEMHVSPGFVLKDFSQVKIFFDWVKKYFDQIKKIAEQTTKHGELIKVEPQLVGNIVCLKMTYDTKDAMGMNMITIASDRAAKYIAQKLDIKTCYPRSNFSSDKKPSMHNFVNGYGRSLHGEVVLAGELIRYLGTTALDIKAFFDLQRQAGILAGMHGASGQIANGVAALFIAAGQDPAQVVNSSIGITSCELIDGQDIYLSVDLPSMLVGTVGGGTKRPYAKTCLELMDCYGSKKSDKFAEIACAVVLAGELSILGALGGGTFVKAHEMYGR